MTPAAALRSVEAELAALVGATLPRITVDVSRVALAVLAREPGLRLHRAALLEHIGPGPVAALDGLRRHALAALEADSLAAEHGRRRPPSEVRTLVAEARALRRRLLAVARGLAAAGALDEARVAALGSARAHGPLDLAGRLSALARCFEDAWPRLGPHPPIALGDLERARALLSDLVATHDDPSAPRRAALQAQRRAAFGLLRQDYNELRRAFRWLRWYEGDARALVPPLGSAEMGGSSRRGRLRSS